MKRGSMTMDMTMCVHTRINTSEYTDVKYLNSLRTVNKFFHITQYYSLTIKKEC